MGVICIECLLPPPPSSQDLVSPPPPAFRPPQNPQNAIVLFQWQVSLLPPLFNFGQQTGFWGQLTSCWAGAPAPYHTAAKVWHSYDEVIIGGKSYSIKPTLEPRKVTITVVPQELNELGFRHIGDWGKQQKRDNLLLRHSTTRSESERDHDKQKLTCKLAICTNLWSSFYSQKISRFRAMASPPTPETLTLFSLSCFSGSPSTSAAWKVEAAEQTPKDLAVGHPKFQVAVFCQRKPSTPLSFCPGTPQGGRRNFPLSSGWRSLGLGRAF